MARDILPQVSVPPHWYMPDHRTTAQLDHDGLTLYTLIIYSENFAGILNQITAVFTRRQVNIE